MTDSPGLTLKQVIDECLQWMITSGYTPGTYNSYRSELDKFLHFIIRKQIHWENIFTLDTLKDFQGSRKSATAPAARKLFRYLFEQKRIHQPIDPPQRRLPDLYEDYLSYYHQTRQVSSIRLTRIRRVLCAFHDYLKRHDIKLQLFLSEQIISEHRLPRKTQSPL